MSKIKVGIVGSGFVAQNKHIPAFKRIKKKAEITCLCDLNKNLATSIAKKHHIRNVYTDLQRMLEREQLDLIDICTPPNAHLSVAEEAMKFGCHVLMEKPMALNVSDCDKMIQSSKDNDVKLSIVHNQKFYPAYIKTKQLFNEGIIGKLLGMRIISLTNQNHYMVHKDHWVHKLPSGIIDETGPHAIYMTLPFLKKIHKIDVHAYKTLPHLAGPYDYYQVQADGPEASCSIIISHAGKYTGCEIELMGEKGRIRTDLHGMTVSLYSRKDLKPSSIAISVIKDSIYKITNIGMNSVHVLFGGTMLGHDIMIDQYVNSIINDIEVPVLPEEGRDTIKAMESIDLLLSNK